MATLIPPLIDVEHGWISAPACPSPYHRGLSKVTYLFLDSEAGTHSYDGLGACKIIQPGGVHWTFGHTLAKADAPSVAGKTVHRLQIFFEHPDDKRARPPFALALEPFDVPVVKIRGVKVRVTIGRFENARSSLRPLPGMSMLDISLEHDAELSAPVAAGHCAFVIPIFGTVLVDGQSFEHKDLELPVFTPQKEPRAIKLRAARGSAKVVLLSGVPNRWSQPEREAGSP